jgi:hypothetical protein
MSAREFLWIVKESALNTPKSSPTAGVDSMYIRLIDGNSFSMYAKPIIEEVPYGGGFAVTAEAISDHYECKGQLKTKLYPSQAALLLGAALTRVDGSGNPWTTSEPVGDLASFSIYHAIQRSDGTLKRTQYSGCKVAGATIEVSRQSTSAMLTLDLIASKSQGNSMDGSSDPSAMAFPAPAETAYPTGPYTFKSTAGGLVIATSGSTARTEYEDLSIKIQNVIDGRWFEQSYLQIVAFCGRATTLDSTIYLKPTPDDRTNFESIAVHAASLVFASTMTGDTCTITFNGQNTIIDLPYDLPLGKAFMTKLSLKNRFDPNAAQDVGFAMS